MYVEYIFAISFLLNYFIVSLWLKAINEKSQLKLFCVSFTSVICSLIVVLKVLSISAFVILILTFLVNVLLCLKTPKPKDFFVSFVVYFLSNFLFLGSAFLVKNFWGLSDVIVVIFASVLYVTISFAYIIINQKRVIKNFLLEVTLVDGENFTREDAYYDSGNLLYDPITHDPICLISPGAFSSLYDVDPLSILLKNYDITKLKNNHYVEINSVSSKGKILVFNVEKVIVHAKNQDLVFENACVGLSMTGFEKAMKSSVLLHSSQLI